MAWTIARVADVFGAKDSRLVSVVAAALVPFGVLACFVACSLIPGSVSAWAVWLVRLSVAQ